MVLLVKIRLFRKQVYVIIILNIRHYSNSVGHVGKAVNTELRYPFG